MASAAATKQAIMRAFDARDARYRDEGQTKSGKEHLSMGFNWENARFRIHVYIDNDGESFHVAAGPVLNVSASKRDKMMAVVNQANVNYRWCKFYIDGDDDIMMDGDVEFTGEGDRALQSIFRMADIYDTAYADFMKAQWA